MDIVDFCKYMYRILRDRETDLSGMLVNGMAQDMSQYRQIVGEVQGLRFAMDEIKALLENNDENAEDTLRS